MNHKLKGHKIATKKYERDQKSRQFKDHGMIITIMEDWKEVVIRSLRIFRILVNLKGMHELETFILLLLLLSNEEQAETEEGCKEQI